MSPGRTGIVVIITYLIFRNPVISSKISFLFNNPLGFLIAGLLFSFGFTTPFSVGFFLTAHPSNIFFSALIAGSGALIADLIIFHIIRFSFMDEFKKLEKEKLIKKIDGEIEKEVGPKLFHYLAYVFAGLVISSPLPDELGVMILSGLTKIKTIPFMIISFTFNTFGVLVMLYLASL